jgi:hypothetical protein
MTVVGQGLSTSPGRRLLVVNTSHDDSTQSAALAFKWNLRLGSSCISCFTTEYIRDAVQGIQETLSHRSKDVRDIYFAFIGCWFHNPHMRRAVLRHHLSNNAKTFIS